MNTIKADSNLKTSENFEENLPLEKRLKRIIELWESDSNPFENLNDDCYLENELFMVLEQLEDRNMWREIERLDRALQCQPQYYKEDTLFVSQSLIPLYLSADREESIVRRDRIENRLKPFCENPENFTEILFELLEKVIIYDQSSIAVDFCKQVYDKIANSDQFSYNPRGKIAEVMVWDGFQEVYIKLKKNEDVDWVHYDNRFKPLEYQYTYEEFKKIEEVMKGNLDLVQIAKISKDQTLYAFFQIQLAFCCHMYDLDGTSFVTSMKFTSISRRKYICKINSFL